MQGTTQETVIPVNIERTGPSTRISRAQDVIRTTSKKVADAISDRVSRGNELVQKLNRVEYSVRWNWINGCLTLAMWVLLAMVLGVIGAKSKTIAMTVLTDRAHYARWDDVWNQVDGGWDVNLPYAYSTLRNLSKAAGCETLDPDQRSPPYRAPVCTCIYREFFQWIRKKSNWTEVPENPDDLWVLSERLRNTTVQRYVNSTSTLRNKLHNCAYSRPVYTDWLYGVTHPLAQLAIVLCIGALCFFSSMTREVNEFWMNTSKLVEACIIAAVIACTFAFYGKHESHENALGSFTAILYLLYAWACTRWSDYDVQYKEEYLWRYVRLVMPIHFLLAAISGDVRDVTGVATVVSVGYMVGFALQQCYVATVIATRGDATRKNEAQGWLKRLYWLTGCDGTRNVEQVRYNWIGASVLGMVVCYILFASSARGALFAQSTPDYTKAVCWIALSAFTVLHGVSYMFPEWFRLVTREVAWSGVHALASLLLVILLFTERFQHFYYVEA